MHVSLASRFVIGLLHNCGGSAPALNVSRPAWRSRTFRPAWSLSCSLQPFCLSASSHVVTSIIRSVSTNRSDKCWAGFAPARNPHLFTAHAISRFLTILILSNASWNGKIARPRKTHTYCLLSVGHRSRFESQGRCRVSDYVAHCFACSCDALASHSQNFISALNDSL